MGLRNSVLNRVDILCVPEAKLNQVTPCILRSLCGNYNDEWGVLNSVCASGGMIWGGNLHSGRKLGKYFYFISCA